MYRLFLLGVIMAVFAIAPGCKKALSSNHPTDEIQVDEARTWFLQRAYNSPASGNPRFSTPRTIEWDKARSLELYSLAVMVIPVHYKAPIYIKDRVGLNLYAIDQLTHLVIYRDSASKFHAEVVTAIPDGSNIGTGAPYKGLTLIESWDGEPLYRIHSDGQKITINQPGTESPNVAAGLITETCYEIDGYNYAADDPDNGENWTEDAGCVPNYYSGSLSSSIGLTAKSYLDIGGGAGSAPPSPAGMFTVVSGNSPIASISDYNKCFTNQPGTDHVYQVALCVEQPVPGTRQPWGFQAPNSTNTNNPVDVGHAFLIFSETYGGTTIIRNIGFYPAGYVDPWHSSSQGQLNNNASTDYDIAVTYTVDNSQFFNILNFVSQGNNSGYMYDLNGNNCTTFCLRALAAGDIIINSTIGFWPGGSGNDPGDLGEDMRNMPLPANATLNSTDSPHPNKGTCI